MSGEGTIGQVLAGEARWSLTVGDCRAWLPTLPDASIDSCVVDPPYELGFMGRKWDASGIAYDVSMWREVLRVLKPGGHLLAFGGTRTYHRMACAIEDAGFDIRDCIQWLYGSGFPKSLDVSKAASAASAAWQGWGTALKPACEPIVVARKPLGMTVASCVLAHGTGGMNIDGCRVAVSDADREALATAGGWAREGYVSQGGTILGGGRSNRPAAQVVNSDADYGTGRWPANIIHDGSSEVLEAFARYDGGRIFGAGGGSAARFFFCAKASRAERELGCHGVADSVREDMTGRAADSAGQKHARSGVTRTGSFRNVHPTVKPLALLRYLCRLVTPPGGIVLDHFSGSGTCGMAALLESFRYLGRELEEHHAAIARARIGHPLRVELEEQATPTGAAQMALFGRLGT